MTDLSISIPYREEVRAGGSTKAQPSRPRRARQSAEYKVYFWVIFMMALPMCTAIWCVAKLRTDRHGVGSPIAQAISQSRIITPMIFAA